MDRKRREEFKDWRYRGQYQKASDNKKSQLEPAGKRDECGDDDYLEYCDSKYGGHAKQGLGDAFEDPFVERNVLRAQLRKAGPPEVVLHGPNVRTGGRRRLLSCFCSDRFSHDRQLHGTKRGAHVVATS